MSLVNGCLKIAANDALSSFETSLKRQKIGHPLRGRQTTIAVGGRSRRTGQLVAHTPVLCYCSATCYVACVLSTINLRHWPEEKTTPLLLKKQQLIYHLLSSRLADRKAVLILCSRSGDNPHLAQLPIHLPCSLFPSLSPHPHHFVKATNITPSDTR